MVWDSEVSSKEYGATGLLWLLQMALVIIIAIPLWVIIGIDRFVKRKKRAMETFEISQALHMIHLGRVKYSGEIKKEVS